MARVSEFYGIVVAVDAAGEAPPHFRATYGGHQASITIGTLRVLRGALPRRALALVFAWANLHDAELLDDWKRACEGTPLVRIPPLE